MPAACARPPFALERLEQVRDDQLVYRLPRPQPDGRSELRLTPLELIERLAALISPPAPAPPPLSRGARTQRPLRAAATHTILAVLMCV